MKARPTKGYRNPPGFQIWRDKKPPFKWRVRHRKSGMTIDTLKFPLYSVGFYVEVDRINKLHTEIEAKPGTLGMLIKRYRASAEFRDPEIGKKARTQADYQRVFDQLKPIEDTALTWFTTPRIVKIRDKLYPKLKRKWANYVITVLSVLFAWGKLRGYIDGNPATEIPPIPRPKNMADANRPWQDAERDAVMAALPAHMKLPFALMMFCGLDPSDALKLPRNAIVNGQIDTRRGKTSVPLYIPAPAPLLAALAAAPKHSATTLCVNSRGLPWTYNGFSTNWDKIKRKLLSAGSIQPGLTLKGLRHTVATILTELGFDERTVADMLGQETIEMARHYSKKANKTRKMTGVVASLDEEMNRRKTQSVKLT